MVSLVVRSVDQKLTTLSAHSVQSASCSMVERRTPLVSMSSVMPRAFRQVPHRPQRIVVPLGAVGRIVEPGLRRMQEASPSTGSPPDTGNITATGRGPSTRSPTTAAAVPNCSTISRRSGPRLSGCATTPVPRCATTPKPAALPGTAPRHRTHREVLPRVRRATRPVGHLGRGRRHRMGRRPPRRRHRPRRRVHTRTVAITGRGCSCQPREACSTWPAPAGKLPSPGQTLQLEI